MGMSPVWRQKPLLGVLQSLRQLPKYQVQRYTKLLGAWHAHREGSAGEGLDLAKQPSVYMLQYTGHFLQAVYRKEKPF